MAFLISIGFAFFVLISCLLVAHFGRKWQLSLLVAFSSGALLVLSFLNFLPHSFSNPAYSNEVISLLIFLGLIVQGAADVYLIPRLKFLDRWIETSSHQHDHNHHHHAHLLSPSTVCSTVGCLALCSFFDGIRLLAGLSMEGYAAVVTMAGLFIHLLSEGVLVALLGISSHMKTRVLLVLTSFISGTLILGAFFAKSFSAYLNPNYLVALATGMLIYICFIHLMPFSLKGKNKNWFVMGMIVFISFHYLFHSSH
ncbi:MAG: hypothetical protein ACR2M7_04185 [Bdellovibrionales bacterium]